MATSQPYFKSLVLRCDNDNLVDMGKRLKAAQDLGKRVFDGVAFVVRDVVHIEPVYVALYEFERSNVSMREGNGQKN